MKKPLFTFVQFYNFTTAYLTIMAAYICGGLMFYMHLQTLEAGALLWALGGTISVTGYSVWYLLTPRANRFPPVARWLPRD